MDKLIPINYENQRIMTTQVLADNYETTSKRISENFNSNKERYEEGKHYFLLQGEELKEFRANTEITDLPSNINKLYLWTEKGALLHAKSLNTNKAWEVYDQLVETYFRVKEGQALNTSQLSPELQMFKQIFNSVASQQLEQQEIKKAIVETKDEIQSIRDVVSISSTDWRKDTAALINKIAQTLGGFEHINNVRSESYKILEQRGGAKLSVRLTNKRRRMADEGVSKSKRDKLNNLDVIADDKKLLETYLAIVKEMAIKYGAA